MSVKCRELGTRMNKRKVFWTDRDPNDDLPFEICFTWEYGDNFCHADDLLLLNLWVDERLVIQEECPTNEFSELATTLYFRG